MENYYEELGIDPSLSLDEIVQVLVEKEQLWHRREINKPEIARKKLVLIDAAKKIFSSQERRRAYDLSLTNDSHSDNVNNRSEWRTWYEQAIMLFNNEQYDLAKTAIENSMSYYEQYDKDIDFLENTARIYHMNNEYSFALMYINKAIVQAPSRSSLYITKGMIFASEYDDYRYNIEPKDQILTSERECFKKACQVAQGKSDDEYSRSLALYAYSLSRTYRASPFLVIETIPPEEGLIIDIAKKAIALGDPSGLAKQICELIAEIKRKRNEAEEERQKQLQRKIEEERAKSVFELIDAKSKENQEIENVIPLEKMSSFIDFIINEVFDRNVEQTYGRVTKDLFSYMSIGRTDGIYGITRFYLYYIQATEVSPDTVYEKIIEKKGKEYFNLPAECSMKGFFLNFSKLANLERDLGGSYYISTVKRELKRSPESDQLYRGYRYDLTQLGYRFFEKIHALLAQDMIDVEIQVPIVVKGIMQNEYRGFASVGQSVTLFENFFEYEIPEPQLHYSATKSLINYAREKGILKTANATESSVDIDSTSSSFDADESTVKRRRRSAQNASSLEEQEEYSMKSMKQKATFNDEVNSRLIERADKYINSILYQYEHDGQIVSRRRELNLCVYCGNKNIQRNFLGWYKCQSCGKKWKWRW